MIIYKIQESGRATDFQFGRMRPYGWWSIDDVDKIPDDISVFHEQKWLDSEALRIQAKTCTQRVKNIEYRISNHPPHPEDVEKNKAYIDLLRACAASDKIQDIPKDPFG